MAAISERARSKSKNNPHIIRRYKPADQYNRFYVPSWVTDDEGKAVQKRAWDDIAKELERIEPGCVQRLL